MLPLHRMADSALHTSPTVPRSPYPAWRGERNGANRLSALDTSFLDVERRLPACMWTGRPPSIPLTSARHRASSSSVTTSRAACSARPATASAWRVCPRLGPRLGDDDRFDITRTSGRPVRPPSASWRLRPVHAAQPERPLWELWIPDRLDDGRIGIVCKAHHCMVDGIAAVELAAAARPRAEAANDRRRLATREPPGQRGESSDGLWMSRAAELALAGSAAGALGSPRSLASGARRAAPCAGPLADPGQPARALNAPISPYRALATLSRPMDELRAIRRVYGCTVNDVVLAASTGGVRRHSSATGNARRASRRWFPSTCASGTAPGARQPDLVPLRRAPVRRARSSRRLHDIRLTMERAQGERRARRRQRPCSTAGTAPARLQHASRAGRGPARLQPRRLEHPRPATPLYMLGCQLARSTRSSPWPTATPSSIGLTTVNDGASSASTRIGTRTRTPNCSPAT